MYSASPFFRHVHNELLRVVRVTVDGGDVILFCMLIILKIIFVAARAFFWGVVHKLLMAYDFSGKTAVVTGAGKGEAQCWRHPATAN